MCLLNENVFTNKKSAYLMKMCLLKGHNLLAINSGLYSFSNFFPISSLSSFLKEKWYVHNIFTTFLQQIPSGRLLLVVIILAKK